jgi:predicted O-methyltransferase YrrM
MEEAVDRYSNLMYVQGWTTQNLADSQAGNHMLGDAPSAFPQVLKVERKIDILFIDSWHNYEYAREDWETYKILLNNPALVICDDIQAGGGPENPISGMLQFWNELPEPKFLNSNLHPGTNLGFIKVSTTTPSRLGE